MAYTTINKPSEYFNTVTWSGNSSNPRNITGVGFQPDLVWGKIKSAGGNHYVIDVVRGSGTGTLNTLNTDDTSVEQTNTSGGSTSFGVYTSFDSDGFTVNAGSSSAKNTNETGQTYVAWNWLGGGTGVSNTDGSITSTVSASTTSGFSIVSYTGNATDGATVGHGLGASPACIIFKNRIDSSSAKWAVYHKGAFVSQTNPNILYLDATEAEADDTNILGGSSVTLNSIVFSLGDYNGSNGSGDAMIAYCFAEKKGYSKFGSYTGNGNADGTFVYTGFKPAWVLVKKTSATDNWILLDNKRDIAPNPHKLALFPNLSDAEAGDYLIDFLSNGFKIRSATGSLNAGSASYIYMAFAEEPLVGTNNIPATAR
jgi:hypothetical protein